MQGESNERQHKAIALGHGIVDVETVNPTATERIAEYAKRLIPVFDATDFVQVTRRIRQAASSNVKTVV